MVPSITTLPDCRRAGMRGARGSILTARAQDRETSERTKGVLQTRFPLRSEVKQHDEWTPFDHNGCPRRSPRGSQLATSGALSLSPRLPRDLAEQRRRDEYVPLGPHVAVPDEDSLRRRAPRHHTTELGSPPKPGLCGLEGQGRAHYDTRDTGMAELVGNDERVPAYAAVGRFGGRGERAHVSHAGQDSSVDEIVFGRDMDGSGVVLDVAEVSRKGCAGRRTMFSSSVDTIVFGRDQDGDGSTELGGKMENPVWTEVSSSKKVFRGALDASVDSIVFGRDTDGSGAVLDGEKDMAPEGTGSYFCTKGMDHYSNRDLGAKHLAHRTPVPSAAQIVLAHNQNAKLHAYGGGGRRVRWDETVPYHAAPVRDESQFRPEGRLF